MCKLKSGVILKDRVFIPEYDSHSKMLEELDIEDTKRNAERLFIRAELSPADGDVFSDISTWIFRADQDILPDWYVPEYDEKRMRAAVKEWAKDHIFVGVRNKEIKNTKGLYLKDCKDIVLDSSTATLQGSSTATLQGRSTATLQGSSTATLQGRSTATLWDRSTATLWDRSTATLRNSSTATLRNNSTATLWDRSTATLYDSSTATLYDSSTATLRNSSTATLYDSSTATLYDSSTATIPDSCYAGKKENYILMENSTLKDCKTKTIYQAGDWKLVRG